jgi:hypothetical protein
VSSLSAKEREALRAARFKAAAGGGAAAAPGVKNVSLDSKQTQQQ